MLDRSRFTQFAAGPGVDTRTWIADGIVLAAEVREAGCFVDVKIPTDVDQREDGTLVYREVTARWRFPGASGGGIVYSKPSVGQKCKLSIANGDPDSGIYAEPITDDADSLPQAVLDDPDSMHLVSPDGSVMKLAADAGDDSTLKEAARRGDAVQSNDAAFFAWVEAIHDWAVVNGFVYVAGKPTSLTSQVSEGSARVLIAGEPYDGS